MRLPLLITERCMALVSIHAPRVGCDLLLVVGGEEEVEVSIHAPRVGCDKFQADLCSLCGRFNSRTPCGVRRSERYSSLCTLWSFNSRTPCGVRLACGGGVPLLAEVSIHAPRVGCDGAWLVAPMWWRVSIHAPRVGCDRLCPAPRLLLLGFNSRTPCGVRPSTRLQPKYVRQVSIHAPRVGCDRTTGL